MRKKKTIDRVHTLIQNRSINLKLSMLYLMDHNAFKGRINCLTNKYNQHKCLMLGLKKSNVPSRIIVTNH